MELLLESFSPPTIVMVGSGAGSVRRGEDSVFFAAGFFSAAASCASDMTDCWLESAGDLLFGRCRIVGM